MDTEWLKVFKAITEHHSLSAAARALGCSQPTLSVTVQRLEAHFHTTLLLRTSRGVEVTSTGRALAVGAEGVLALLADLEQQIAGLESGEVGRFVVGCNDSLGAYFLPGFLGPFMAAAPGIDVTLWNGPSDAVLQRVVDRDLHFGLVVNPRPHLDLVLVELFGDAVDLFATVPAPDRAAAHARIAAGPLVYVERLPQSGAYLDHFAAEGCSPRRVLTCGELELVKSLVLGGLGIGVLPRRVAAYGHPGKLRRLHPSLPFMPDRIALVYRVDLHRTRAALRLKDALVAHGRRMAEDEGVSRTA
ncbi:MAG: LysR family transcriptional regulator [bacterium]|nr:LysR family transcriptional regulator [Myxococcales bacterium]MCB9542448.1 LysR family transcriptional regulator [Myxococcales bacterium]